MPLRPFPVPFRVGTDLVHIPRITALITKTATGKAEATKVFDTTLVDSFLRRVFTPHEQELFWKRFKNFNCTPGQDLDSASSYLAGRFAAKEAAIKAIRNRRITYRQVEIRRNETLAPHQHGSPYAVILDMPSDEVEQSSALGEDPSGLIVDVSISHDGEYATAVCIAPEQPLEGDVGGELAARTP